ncbi:MAG: DUF1016 family protein [Candidatus Omnitrophica bacterium]|nr:DUF1016 family protein [Candidatus Omnitrophota bacterium]
MPNTTLPSKTDSRLASFSFLTTQLKKVFAAGLARAQSAVEEERTRTYLEAGRLIDTHILFHKERAGYGDKIIVQLSKQTGVSDSILYDALHLYREDPISPAQGKLASKSLKKLTWTDQRNLLALSNKEERKQLGLQAQALGWSTRELAQAIRKIKKPEKSPKKLTGLLAPKRGRVNTYEIFEDDGRLVLDYGFRRCKDLTKEQAQRFKTGDLVETAPGEKIRKLSSAKASDLYTYSVALTKIIDGDTFWVKIYFNQIDWAKIKLRLRGVDAPERDTPEGKAAKKFVEEELGKSVEITVKTTPHPDKWDRYLVDVFLKQKDGSEIFLNNLLLETGHARRVDTYRDSDWEK